MRRVVMILLLIGSLLISAQPVIKAISPATVSYSSEPMDSWSSKATLSDLFSPSPPVAYVTNISTIAHWQQVTANQVNATRLLELLTSFTSFPSRHPFVAGGNASLNYLAFLLSNLGCSVISHWFPILRKEWNGTTYVLTPYWTANLYTMFESYNPAFPSLIVTAHVDSARHTIFGLDPSGAPGANANAAGVSAILEAIRVLVTQSRSFSNWNLIFTFLGGEEGNGTLSLWGSREMVAQGFSILGVDPATAVILNVDEIGYSGLVLPTELTIYRYPMEDLASILAALRAASSVLNIPLLDTGAPRVASLQEVQTALAWSNSEWTFHTQNIPSITISTNLYPDPLKHTASDTASRCCLQNIQNVTKLLVAMIFALTYEVPESPQNYVEDWVPALSAITPITIVDYMNLSTNSFKILILDPALIINALLKETLLLYQRPIFALGKAGAMLLQRLTGSIITTAGTRSLTLDGIKAFHPAIKSPSLLQGDESKPFISCPTVYAVTPEAETLVLVGDTSWCSMGYFPESEHHPPLQYLGVNAPITETIVTLSQASLTWLLEGSTAGLCLGVHHPAPQVGTSTTIYILMYNFTNWTGIAQQPLLVNVTTSHHDANISQNLMTNQSGIASMPYWIRSPNSLNITAQTDPNITTSMIITPTAAATVEVMLSSQAFQGQKLYIDCWVTSQIFNPTYVNLSLSHPLVGATNKTNLLLMPDINLYRLQFSILPNCPPGPYSLLLILSASETVLLIAPIDLEIKQAFSLTFLQAPTKIIQQQPFEVLLNLTNMGLHTCHFDIIAHEGNFEGFTSLSLEANRSKQLTMSLVYTPDKIMDVGTRNLTIALYLDECLVLECHTPIQVEYSALNSLITLLPPLFLVGLCLLGIWRHKNPRKPQQTSHSSKPGRFSHLVSKGLPSPLAFSQSTYQFLTVQSYPFSWALEKDLKAIICRFGLIARGTNHFYNQHSAVICKRKGDQLQLRVFSNNQQFLTQFLSKLPPRSQLSPGGKPSL